MDPDLRARFTAWARNREILNAMENGDDSEFPIDLDAGHPTADEWHHSDDEAVELLHEFFDAATQVKVFSLDGSALHRVIDELLADPLETAGNGAQIAVEIDEEGCYIRARMSPWAAWRAPEMMTPA